MPEPLSDPWRGASPQSFKPMVRVGDVMYRVTRIGADEYEVVRIVDDCRIGTFASFPELEITSAEVDPASVREIALLAGKATRSSWPVRIARALRRRTSSGVRRTTDV